MQRTYRYVGPKKIAQRVAHLPTGVQIRSPDDVLRWIQQTGQELRADGSVIVTFVIDESGCLRIADRRSEHVACAGGMLVQSAGEMTFEFQACCVSVAEVSNQSTGYCPEPDSWPAVEASLARAGIPCPREFSHAFVFRRCAHCGSINIIKDGIFECGVCVAPLPTNWNLDCPID